MSEVSLDPLTIYNYDTHRNIPWNIVEYQPVREYLDPRKNIQEQQRKNAQATHEPYVTKRGSFLDEYLKTIKGLPAPCRYDFTSQFDQTVNIKKSNRIKINLQLRKNSYLDQIQSNSKRIKSPAVGQYNLSLTSRSKSHKKKLKQGEKRFFYQDSQFLSTMVPGSGEYCPHDSIPTTKTDRMTSKDWIEKHSQQRAKDRKRRLKEPDPGTYIPIPMDVNSFDKIKRDNEKRKKKAGNNKSTHGFGSSDSKFPYQRPKKSKEEKKPDPCHYNTYIDWKGKGESTKKNIGIRCLSAGPARSIYH